MNAPVVRLPIAHDPSAYLPATFGPDGHLARALPGYTPRPQQQQLARAIDAALWSGGGVIADSPCGSGKSFAYLVPATHHAATRNLRVLVATGGLTLQEQLLGDDVPTLARALPWPVDAVLLKGLGNYLCREAYEGADEDGGRDDVRLAAPERAELARVDAWARRTATGDRAELSFVPSPAVWSRRSTSSEECRRQGCSAWERCHWRRARAAADEASVVVVNHHLLCAHLAWRAMGFDQILPEFDAAIIDEAHGLGDVARRFFGFELAPGRFLKLARWARKRLHADLAADLRDASHAFFDAVAAVSVGTRLTSPISVDARPLVALTRQVAELARAAADRRDLSLRERIIGENTWRRAKLGAGCLAEVATLGGAPHRAYWVERDGVLVGRPLDIDAQLRAELWDRTRVVVATSATLATGPGDQPAAWTWSRQELGAPAEIPTLATPSPFDFATQALLVLPTLPDPQEMPSQFRAAVGRVLVEVVRQAGGRTLALFTSFEALDAAHRVLLAAGLPYRVLRQGELPKRQLVEAFRRDETSVLLASASFREGVDVPGPALSAVLVDRLSFPTPDDPLTAARKARGDRWFEEHALPSAVIALRQALGRGVRRTTDRAALVVCDPRLVTKRYGAGILAALGLPAKTRNVADIGPFLAGAPREALRGYQGELFPGVPTGRAASPAAGGAR